MRSENPEERRDLLENLEEAEVRRAYLKEESDQERNRALFGRPASLIAVRQILKPDELLLEYVLDEPKSFCLTVSRTETRLIGLPAGRRQIEDLSDRYLNQVEVQQGGDETAAQLHQMLVAPVASQLGNKRLIILPDGKLHLLPFDSLRDAEGHYLTAFRAQSTAPTNSTW